MFRTFVLLSLGAFLQVCLPAQTSSSAPSKAASPTAKPGGAPPQGATAGEKQAEALLLARLATSVIGRDGITARAEAGTIYLEGTTAVPQHKGAATRMAKSVMATSPTIRRVVNNIRISQKGSRPVAHPTGAKSSTPQPVTPPPGAPAKLASEDTARKTDTSRTPGAPNQPSADVGPRRVTVRWK